MKSQNLKTVESQLSGKKYDEHEMLAPNRPKLPNKSPQGDTLFVGTLIHDDSAPNKNTDKYTPNT